MKKILNLALLAFLLGPSLGGAQEKISTSPLPESLPESLPVADSKGVRTISLQDAFHEASKNNVKVLLAQEKNKEVHGRVWESYSGWLPHLSGHVFQSRETINLASLGFEPGIFPGLQNTLLGPFNNFDARVSLVQNIFSYAALGDLRAAKEEAKKTHLEEILTQQLSALEAGIAYLDLLEAEANLKGAKSDVELANRLYRWLKDEYDAGIANIVDRTRAETQFSFSQSLALQAETRVQEADLQLKRIMGWPLDTKIRLSSSLLSIADPSSSLEESLRRAYEKRMEIKVATAEISRKEMEVKGAWGRQFPSLSFNADYGGSGNQPNKNLDATYQFGVQLQVPMFDGGLTAGRIMEAKSLARQAQILLQDLRTQVEQEVRLAHNNLTLARSRLKSSKEAFHLATQQMGQIQDQYKTGIGDSLALVSAQNSLTRAREEYWLALVQYQAARLSLAYAEGDMDQFQL
jgi:outer membrane protein TolC